MIRLLVILFGSLLMLLGIVLWILPIPFGILVMALALMILIAASDRVARMVGGVRRRSPRTDRAFHGLGRRLPHPYRRILRRTEPGARHRF